MKIRMIFPFLLSLLFLFSTSSQAKHYDIEVVYGEDDRLDLYDVTDLVHYEIAASTAAMLPPRALKKANDGSYEISAQTLEEQGICAGEKFSDQPTAAYCSGFLVGDDLLVTAGHCVETANDCSTYKWVFDYGYTDASHKLDSINEDSVYSCKKIVERKLDGRRGSDYALIQLDRKVVGKTPLKVRTTGEVAKDTPLVVIGHPTGLPTKVAAGAWVRENNQSAYFVANLDTFGGNSGSAVFDSKTGVVEGILVRGEQDYTYDRAKQCLVPKVCSNTGCSGEDVTRITEIKSL